VTHACRCGFFVYCLADATASKRGNYTAVHEGGGNSSLANLRNRHAQIYERGGHAVYEVRFVPHGERTLTVRNEKCCTGTHRQLVAGLSPPNPDLIPGKCM
jgi:hypothetical protein